MNLYDKACALEDSECGGLEKSRRDEARLGYKTEKRKKYLGLTSVLDINPTAKTQTYRAREDRREEKKTVVHGKT